MKKIYLTLILGATLMQAVTNEVSLDIYTDKIRLNDIRGAQNDKVYSFEVPSYLNLENIDVIGACDISSKTLSTEVEAEDKTLLELKENVDKNSRVLSSLKTKESLLKSATLDKVANIENVDKLYKKTGDLLLENLNEQSKITKELEKAQKALTKYSAENPPKKVKLLHVNPEYCTKNSDNFFVQISYDFYEMDAKPIKKIYANLNENSTKIDEFLHVKNLSSIDLQKITVRSLGTRFVKAVKPANFYPNYLDVPNKNRAVMMEMAAPAPIAENRLKQVSNANFGQAVVQNLDTLSAWTIKNVNIPRGENVELNLNTQVLPSVFTILVDGYSQSYPFVESEFTLKDRVEGSEARFYLNNLAIANSNVATLFASVPQKLYFGTNEHIKVDKKETKNFTENSVFGTKTQSLKWEYNIKNISNKAWKVKLLERLPVSKNEKITVILVADEKPVKQEEDGKVYFEFTLKPNESKKFEYGYDIKMPKDM
ncbi:MAG: DUF4139 domain-containing protein [Campylobacteraceae bacterium]